MANLIGGAWCLGRPGFHRWINGDERKHVRCPDCGRRLLAAEVHDEDGLLGYAIPDHKTRTYKIRRPKGDRKGRLARRG
jgi:hypothetical protein